MAIRELKKVNVDTSGWELELRVIRPATRQRETPAGRVREPRMRNGIQGVELEVLVWSPSFEEEMRCKITTFQTDLPTTLNRRDMIRIRGPLFAAAWSAADGSSGLYFEVPEGIELVGKPAAPVKAGA